MEELNIDQLNGVAYKIETNIIIFTSSKIEYIMEKKLNKKFEEKEKINELMGFVYDYERLIFKKDDISKRKRIKNTIPNTNRCNAKRANNEQCTRRKKEGCEYCGTHIKGTPHGLVSDNITTDALTYNMNLVAQEIGGIVYYIDNYNNVYNTEDVMNGTYNPSIIAKYTVQNGTFSIPELGI